jgi:hypothetical protein
MKLVWMIFPAILITAVVGMSYSFPSALTNNEQESYIGGKTTCTKCVYGTVEISTASYPSECDSGTYYTGISVTSGKSYKVKTKTDPCGSKSCHGFEMKSKVGC